MNKTLKYTLIGLGVAAVGTTLYFVLRKPKDKSGDEGKDDKKEPEKKEESKDTDTQVKDTSSSSTSTPKTDATKPTATTTPLKLDREGKVTSTAVLKGYGVSAILSKVQNPAFLKGKLTSSSKDGTILMGAKGNKLFTLKKDTIVGTYVSSSLTKTGNYLVNVKMNNGKSVLVNGTNLKFS
jgi:hypothetical protein